MHPQELLNVNEGVLIFISVIKYKYITLLSSIKAKNLKYFQNISKLSARDFRCPNPFTGVLRNENLLVKC